MRRAFETVAVDRLRRIGEACPPRHVGASRARPGPMARGSTSQGPRVSSVDGPCHTRAHPRASECPSRPFHSGSLSSSMGTHLLPLEALPPGPMP